MLFVSTGLSISAFIIDINYLQRKFRVIADQNELFKLASTLNTDQNERKLSEIREYFRISGDSGSDSYKRVKGFPGAVKIALSVYFIPIIVLWVSWACYMLRLAYA